MDGFIQVPFGKDGKMVVRGRKQKGGPLLDLGSYTGVTIPMPLTSDALAKYWDGVSYKVTDADDNVVATFRGVEAAAARTIAHDREADRGAFRAGLLEGKQYSNAVVQKVMASLPDRKRGSKAPAMSVDEAKALSKADLIERLRSTGHLG